GGHKAGGGGWLRARPRRPGDRLWHRAGELSHQRAWPGPAPGGDRLGAANPRRLRRCCGPAAASAAGGGEAMTYQIHRYPADLIDVVQLGGERVVISPVLPQDADLTEAFFSNLSPRARHQRFLSPMRLLPPGLVERLTDIDYSQHLALVAEVFAGGRETVIAEARYARLPDAESAEFAISVAEAGQGQGLARRLEKKQIERAAAAT